MAAPHVAGAAALMLENDPSLTPAQIHDRLQVTAAQLLAPAYLQQRAAQIDPQRAGSYPAGQPSSGGTVYLCTADAQGRMVSFIQSNFKGFGSGVVVPGTGIALHNRGMGFVTTPGHPNQVAGGNGQVLAPAL